jgi:ATP-binding cassette, subfamily F, member 3
MLKISNLSKSYGEHTVLAKVSFTLHTGERAGLIGPNGAGKSTLLKIIIGEEQPDAGSVWLDPAVRFGYLSQALVYEPGATVGQVIADATGGAQEILQRLETLGAAIATADATTYDSVMDAYARALDDAERVDAYGAEARLAEVLAGLELAHLDSDTPVSILSGGQKTRLGLARLLLAKPDLLLLDEPTNHLDIDALEWLEKFIREYKGAVLIVSHDRTFIDETVSKILAMDAETHTLRELAGTYSDYIATLERERQKHWDAYTLQQEKIARIESDIDTIKRRSIQTELSTINFAIRKKAARGARTAIVRERKLERLLNSEEKIEKPKQSWKLKLDFGDAPPSGQMVLALENVSKRFDDNVILQDTSNVVKQGERIALVGANGTGKTTLLRLIGGELAPDSGAVRLGANVRPGYFSQEQENLNPRQTPLEVVRHAAPISETDARNFLHFFLFSGDEVFTPVGNLSYGQRARLALARLVLGRVNLLLLDEPLNHLDLTSREQFEEALANYEGTVIAVAHDRYFVSHFAERLWSIADGKLRTFYDLDEYEARG